MTNTFRNRQHNALGTLRRGVAQRRPLNSSHACHSAHAPLRTDSLAGTTGNPSCSTAALRLHHMPSHSAQPASKWVGHVWNAVYERVQESCRRVGWGLAARAAGKGREVSEGQGVDTLRH